VSEGPTVPLVELPERALAELERYGVPRSSAGSKLYRALANQPSLLMAWIDMAWTLRRECSTPARIRELMVVRAGEMVESEYVRAGHRKQALALGVPLEELDAVADWRRSPLFDDSDRAALTLLEDMVSGTVQEATSELLAKHFDPGQRIELIVTAGMYSMVPRVISALALVPD
jgi:alkylhydroperoxidase family enzyme